MKDKQDINKDREDMQRYWQKILEEIIKSIQQISYGEVVITIYNSKIVQIEKREKKRFNQDQSLHKQS